MEKYICVNCMGEMAKEEKFCRHCGFDAAGYVQPPNALKKETILNGRYLVGRVMGQGGFGITYVGYDLKLELKVAVKEYFPGRLAGRNNSQSNTLQWSFTNREYQKWNDNIESFLNEARKMAKLDEVPGIVRVRDCFRDNQTAYIVMDFAEGVTLSEYLKKCGRMNYVSCIKLLLPVMESLEIMHEKGLVHRDISPDNLMIQKNDREMKVKLLDFGAAIEMRMEHSGETESFVKKGYSAPEQYMESGNIGRWSDVYAMAAVIYRCVTGTEIPEAMERIMRSAGISMKGISNKAARRILADALSLKTEERIGTMDEFRKALEETLPAGRRKGKKLLAAAAAVVACSTGIGVLSNKPWLPSVERLGTTNSNQYQGANYASVYEQYKYFVDEEWNLCVCPFVEEDQTYHLKYYTIVDDEANYVNIGKDKIYFIHDNTENPEEKDALIEMDFDGSHKKVIIEDISYNYLQYAALSDGKEMLYYLKDNGDDEDQLSSLCRYDLKTGNEEKLLDEDVYWYNLDGKYIYYITFNNLVDETQLKRASLNGKGARMLNDKDCLISGYIEEGTAYLLSCISERLEICGLDGTVRENPLGEYADAICDGCSLYDGGWIYYSPSGSGEIHRIRPDGTGESVIYTGENVLLLGAADNTMWFMTGNYKADEGKYQLDHTYYMDDSSVFALGVHETDDGLMYKEADGEIVLTGYMGNEDYVVVPQEFEEGEWKGQVADSFPDQVDIYVYAREPELSYESTEDGTGVILTGYSGEETGEYTMLAFPEEIDGAPVVELGKNFMSSNKTVEKVILPESLQTIGENAFTYCSSLRDVKLPEGLTYISGYAFYDTALKEITFPASLENFQSDALVNMEKVNVSEGNPAFSVEDEVLYVTTDGNKVVKLVLTSKTGDYVVPQGITAIASCAFEGSQVSSVILPQSVKNIYTEAFSGAEKLQRVVISEGTEALYAKAFMDCISLSDIIIPRSVTSIGSQAFAGCSSLREVTISRTCTVSSDSFERGVQINYYD